jgi:phospholipid-translocating ATPase
MILALWLFNDMIIYIVTITFTALMANELILIALEIDTWYGVIYLGTF